MLPTMSQIRFSVVKVWWPHQIFQYSVNFMCIDASAEKFYQKPWQKDCVCSLKVMRADIWSLLKSRLPRELMEKQN